MHYYIHVGSELTRAFRFHRLGLCFTAATFVALRGLFSWSFQLVLSAGLLTGLFKMYRKGAKKAYFVEKTFLYIVYTV